MDNRKKWLNIGAGLLALLLLCVVIWGIARGESAGEEGFSDGIRQPDLDSLDLRSSGVEVDFSQVLVSNQHETRKLIISTQTGTVSTKLTERLIRQLDFDFMTKTQEVSYTGTGYFVVDLDRLTAARVKQDPERKTVTVLIDHAYLQAIEIDPDDIVIGEVKESLLAWGEIELTMEDYNTIEKQLRVRLEEQFNTAENGQKADELALKMVKEVYEPIVKAVDRRYTVEVGFW